MKKISGGFVIHDEIPCEQFKLHKPLPELSKPEIVITRKTATAICWQSVDGKITGRERTKIT